jgi:hypothetical protein
MGEGRCLQGFGGETKGGGDHLEDPYLGGRIIIKWIFNKWVGEASNGLIWLGIGTGGRVL